MKPEDTLATYNMLISLLNENENEKTEDDKIFRKSTTKQITERDTQYTELLSHFVKITRIRNILKEFFKWSFYLVIIGSIIALAIIIYLLFKKYISSASIQQLIDSMPLLITSMVGFISTIIAIPVTITKYLFSTNEDQNITKIILHTQEHDVNGRQWAMDFKNFTDDLEKASNSSYKNTNKEDSA